MRASTKRILSIFFSIFLSVAAALVYIKMIQPTYDEIQGLRGKIQARQNLLAQQKNAVSQLTNLQNELQNQNIAQFQEAISLVFPLTENMPQALSQIETIAQTNGLNVQSITFSYQPLKPSAAKTEIAKGIGTLRFRLKLLGSYEAIKEFVKTIETNVRLIDVAELKLNRSGQPGQNLYLAEITADCYYQSER